MSAGAGASCQHGLLYPLTLCGDVYKGALPVPVGLSSRLCWASDKATCMHVRRVYVGDTSGRTTLLDIGMSISSGLVAGKS